MSFYNYFWLYQLQPILLYWSIFTITLYVVIELLLKIFNRNSLIFIENETLKFSVYSIIIFPVLEIFQPLHFEFQIPVNHWAYLSNISNQFSIYLFFIFFLGFITTISIYLIRHREILFMLLLHKQVNDESFIHKMKEVSKSLDIENVILTYYTKDYKTPFVIWFFGYKLFFPKTFMKEMNDRDIKAVLTHELTHIKNRDIFINHLLHIMHFPLWFLPPIYYFYNRIILVQEKISDLSASKNYEKKVDYAELLFRVASDYYYQDNPLPVTGFAKRDSQTMSRFRFIVSDLNSVIHPSKSSYTYMFKTFIFLIAIFFSMFKFGVSQPSNFDVLVENEIININYQTRSLDNFKCYDDNKRPESFYSATTGNTLWLIDDTQWRTNHLIEAPPQLMGYLFNPNTNLLDMIGTFNLPIIIDNDQNGNPYQYPTYEIHLGINNNIRNDLLVIEASDLRFLNNNLDSSIQPAGGLYILDVSNPTNPMLLSHIPSFIGSGLRVLKNDILISTMKMLVVDDIYDIYYAQNFLIGYDISNPLQPKELWRGEIPNNDTINCADIMKDNSNIVFGGGRGIYTYKVVGSNAQLISRTRCKDESFFVRTLESYPNNLYLTTQALPNLFEPLKHCSQKIALLDSNNQISKITTYNHESDLQDSELSTRIVRLLSLNNHKYLITDKGVLTTTISDDFILQPNMYFKSDFVGFTELVGNYMIIGGKSIKAIEIDKLQKAINSSIEDWISQ